MAEFAHLDLTAVLPGSPPGLQLEAGTPQSFCVSCVCSVSPLLCWPRVAGMSLQRLWQGWSRDGFGVGAEEEPVLISARPARALQNIVSKHSSQFRGNAQHDALEFLLWLLDRMHEDLGAASPMQQSRGPTQVGVPGGGRTPWLGGRRSGHVRDQEN